MDNLRLLTDLALALLAALLDAGLSLLRAVLGKALSPALELAVVALPEAHSTRLAVRTVKRLRSGIAVIARVRRVGLRAGPGGAATRPGARREPGD